MINRLAEFDREPRIYACEPWTVHLAAICGFELMEGGLPDEVDDAGMIYFLEIDIGIEFAEGWTEALKCKPHSLENTIRDTRDR